MAQERINLTLVEKNGEQTCTHHLAEALIMGIHSGYLIVDVNHGGQNHSTSFFDVSTLVSVETRHVITDGQSSEDYLTVLGYLGPDGRIVISD